MASSKIGPNAPCPCGSGRKFKRCCQTKSSADSAPATDPIMGGKFRFEAGSYGGKGMFAASISCHKQVRPDEWVYHFVLANPNASFTEELAAVDAAKQHLEDAFAERRRAGSDEALAAYLKRIGYVSVEDFKVVKESSDRVEH